MKSLNARPVAVAGIATLVTAMTVTGSRVTQGEVSPPRLLAESIQLQALVTPAAAATAAAIGDPGRILTDVAKAAVSVAAAAAWVIAFPITLPVSVEIAIVVNSIPGLIGNHPIPEMNPLLPIGIFLAIPTSLIQNSFTDLGLSLGLIEQPDPPAAAASPHARRAGAPPVAARKQSGQGAAAQIIHAGSARSALIPSAAAVRGAKTETRSVAHGRRP